MKRRATFLGAGLSLCAVFVDPGYASARGEDIPRANGATSFMAISEPTARSAITWSSGAAEHIPIRGYAVVVHVPARVRLVNGAFDVIMHFHGSPEIQEGNVERAALGAIVVTVNAGVVSGQYEKTYAAPGAFAMFKQAALNAAVKTGRFTEPRINHIGVSTWSAGFGALQAMANDKTVHAMDEIDAVLIADGVFTRWQSGKAKKVHWEPIQFLLDYAARARRGEKLLAITHTEILTQGYPSMPEVMGAFVSELGLTRGAPPKGQGGDKGGLTMFPASYRASEGSLWVTGHKGKTFDAHNEELSRMDRTMLPMLRDRWNVAAE